MESESNRSHAPNGRPAHSGGESDRLLGQRLAALPLETPPKRGWSELRARIESTAAAPRRRRAPAWLALAAGVAAVSLFASLWQRAAPPVDVGAAPVNPVTTLVQRSQSLETQIRGLRANAPDVDEMRYAWESAVEADLAAVDMRLTSGAALPEELWRQRVRLLEELRAVTTIDTGDVLLHARVD